MESSKDTIVDSYHLIVNAGLPPLRSSHGGEERPVWFLARPAMRSRTPEHWLEVETIGVVAVGRFIHCRILHEEAVEEAGRQMLALSRDTGCPNVLLDLDNVEGMTTAFVGKLVSLYNQ